MEKKLWGGVRSYLRIHESTQNKIISTSITVLWLYLEIWKITCELLSKKHWKYEKKHIMFSIFWSQKTVEPNLDLLYM